MWAALVKLKEQEDSHKLQEQEDSVKAPPVQEVSSINLAWAAWDRAPEDLDRV
jgi:hypothetical protein